MVEPPQEEEPGATAEEAGTNTISRRIARRCDPSCDACDGCDVGSDIVPGCDIGCDIGIRVSALLTVAAVAAPPRPVVLAALHGYRRWLSPLTTRCPSTPSCSAYAVAVVRRFGARRGLQLAAARLHRCGRTRSAS